VLERSPIQRAGSSGRGVVVGNKLAGIDSATLRLAPFDGADIDEQSRITVGFWPHRMT
jgi:hypothetical protein